MIRIGMGNNMTRLDIAKIVSKETAITQQKANEAVVKLFNVIKEALQRGERIECRGFGIFTVRERNPRVGRNPRTGEEAPISRGRTIKFKPGKEFKDLVSQEPAPASDSAKENYAGDTVNETAPETYTAEMPV
jgi:DNA-binding protein HU-beta